MAKKEKTTGKDIVKWEQELANLAKQTKKGITVSEGKFISFKSGKMTFGGADIPDNEIRCVIVGWTHHNAYFDPSIPYDPKNPATPICYSFGTEPDEMQPHTDSPDVQCGSCEECPFNKFESAERGKGKACKNTFRLALISEDDLENLDGAEVAYVSIPPMSLKNFANYIGKDLDKLARPHWSVITTMSCVPDAGSQFKVLFKYEESIEDTEKFGPLKALWEKTMEGIGFPYVVREAAPAPAKGKASGGKGKPSKFAKR